MARDKHIQSYLDLPGVVLIGRGNQGDVYRIDHDRCIKVARDRSALRREIRAMTKGQPCPYFPRLHEHGPDFMVREYVPGISLSQHLEIHPLTPDLARELASLLIWLRELGFRRIDTRLHHVIVGPHGLRLIDPSNLNKETDPFPRKVWRGLTKRGHAERFRLYLRQAHPRLYAEWARHMAK